MKKLLICLSTSISVFLVGCAAPIQQQKIQLKANFDKEQAEKLLEQGQNTIKGSALMRQVSGGVVTCAGRKVSLLPATDYALERIRYLYGNDTAGTISAYTMQNNIEPFTSTNPDYQRIQKNTLCDAQGFFKFEKVADGEFFITTTISWKANPNSIYFEGGGMMRRVKVKDGETVDVVIAP